VIEIVIDAADPETLRLSGAVGELTERLPARWVLIGGLMVQRHAIEHGIVDVRPTRDIDLLGEARPPGALPAIDAVLRDIGFDLHDPDLDGYGHRYERDGIVVDVLAPDGIKPPPTLGGGVTAVGVPGETQALGRSEMVTVRVGELSFELRRPTLLGAILIKARSLLVHADPASQREDLLRLLSLVGEPRELSVELRDTERRWLRQAEARLDFQAVSLLSADLQRRAGLAYRLLTRSSAETDRSGGAVRRRSSQAPEDLDRREDHRGHGPLSR
jgi:hypothetical protein